ncbi:hypothetical protein ABBQ38_008223 [Trebouxia sp. C0009 RCD-2024]
MQTGHVVDLYHTQDNSGRQIWLACRDTGGRGWQLTVSGGHQDAEGRHALSCGWQDSEQHVDLWVHHPWLLEELRPKPSLPLRKPTNSATMQERSEEAAAAGTAADEACERVSPEQQAAAAAAATAEEDKQEAVQAEAAASAAVTAEEDAQKLVEGGLSTAAAGDLPRGFFRLRSAVRKEGGFRAQYLGLHSTAESEKQLQMGHKLCAVEWLVEPVADYANAVTLTAAAENTPQHCYLGTFGGYSHVRLCDLEPECDGIVWSAKAGAQPNLWHFSSMAVIGQEPHARRLTCCCPTADGSEQLVLGHEHSWELVPVSNHCTTAGEPTFTSS